VSKPIVGLLSRTFVLEASPESFRTSLKVVLFVPKIKLRERERV
jgi:hypothetical protein